MIKIKELMDSKNGIIISKAKNKELRLKKEITDTNLLGIFITAFRSSFFPGISRRHTFNCNLSDYENTSDSEKDELQPCEINSEKANENCKVKKKWIRINENSGTESQMERTEFCYANPEIKFGFIAETKFDNEDYKFPALYQTKLFEDWIGQKISRILVMSIHYNSGVKRSEIRCKLIDKEQAVCFEGTVY